MAIFADLKEIAMILISSKRLPLPDELASLTSERKKNQESDEKR